MAVEKISLAEIEALKEEEEMAEIDNTQFDDMEEPDAEYTTKTVIKRAEDGSQKEFMFVPDDTEDDTLEARRIQAIMDNLPVCDEEYIRAEMEKTGASPEEVVADYLALIDVIIENGEIPEE